jgi:hypothetical protein
VAIGIIAICILVLTAKPVPAVGLPLPPSVASKDQAAIIENIVEGLRRTYVFPEVAEQMAQHLQKRLAAGVYDSYGGLEAFCEVLTEDLQSISHDKHLRVRWQPPPDEGQSAPATRNAGPVLSLNPGEIISVSSGSSDWPAISAMLN